MQDRKDVVTLNHAIDSSRGSEASIDAGPKTSKSGVVLVPQPTDDPKDPLVSDLSFICHNYIYVPISNKDLTLRIGSNRRS